MVTMSVATLKCLLMHSKKFSQFRSTNNMWQKIRYSFVSFKNAYSFNFIWVPAGAMSCRNVYVTEMNGFVINSISFVLGYQNVRCLWCIMCTCWMYQKDKIDVNIWPFVQMKNDRHFANLKWGMKYICNSGRI